MRHCEILLPFGLPPAALAADLLRELHAPALAALLAKSAAPKTLDYDPFARCLPHEAWLAARQGYSAMSESSPPIAGERMRNLNLGENPGTWFVLHPVHIHIARDHLVLTDRRRLPISEVESRALFDTARPAFDAAGKTVLYGSPDTWFVRADAWNGLHTASPDAACGHNVDIWMPKGAGEREWRKLQNEVQMEWHEHPVNAAREARREPAVNSLWLWGGATLPSPAAAAQMHQSGRFDSLSAMLDSPENTLAVLDNLSETALAEEWGNWLEQLQLLEQHWFAPLLQALQSGQIGRLTLLLGHNSRIREFTLGKSALLKFWARPSLSRLLP